MFFSCLTVELTRLGPNLPVENVFIFKMFRKNRYFGVGVENWPCAKSYQILVYVLGF